jgi:hypothetical protein
MYQPNTSHRALAVMLHGEHSPEVEQIDRRAVVYQLAEGVMVTFVLIGDDDDNPVDAYVDCGNYADGSRTTAALSHEAFAPLWAELQGAFDYVEVPTRAARTCVNGHPLGEDGTCDAWCDERVTR